MSHRKFFKPAEFNKLYSAGEFNRVLNTVSELSEMDYTNEKLFLRTRHAITHAGSGTYPAFGDFPDTYALKWVYVEYTKSAGKNAPTITYWDGGSSNPLNNTAEDDFVHNVARWGQSGDLYTPYIPEGTIIQCYFNQGSWFTEWWAQTTQYRGTLKADMDDTDDEGTIENLMPLNGPDLGLEEITFKNIHEDTASTGAIIVAAWNAWLKQWELRQLTCG